MIKTVCDGPCGRELGANTPGQGKPSVCLNIDRVDGMGGGGIPSGRSHLCRDCAGKAFNALKETR